GCRPSGCGWARCGVAARAARTIWSAYVARRRRAARERSARDLCKHAHADGERPLTWSMTEAFDIVPIGVKHKSSVVTRMVVRAQPRGTIVPSARCKGSTVKRVHRWPIPRDDRDVHRLFQLTFA